MSKLALNKSNLHKESDKLKTFQQFLPALDMKRKQIIAERNQARSAYQNINKELELFHEHIAEQLPMLSDQHIDLSGLIKLKKIDIGKENIVGVAVPVLNDYAVEISDYSRMALPVWTDLAFDMIEQMIRLKLLQQIARQRLNRLEAALQKTTQRLNLFEKVLIPQAKKNIRSINLFLADGETAAVVRAKIAKEKRASAQSSPETTL